MSPSAAEDKLKELEKLNAALNLRVAEMRESLARAESRAVKLYLTLDDSSNQILLPGRDFDGHIRDELVSLARSSRGHLRVAIPYVTRAGYRDLTALTRIALDNLAQVSVMFRRPESKSDSSIYQSFASDFHRYVDMGQLRIRYMGQEGRSGLHAKVVISDSSEALVSSANLTGYALTSNVEVGLATRSSRIVHSLTVWFDIVFDKSLGPSQVFGNGGVR